MERDLDLDQRILQDVETIPPGRIAGPTYYPDTYPDEVVREHIKRLHKEGFIDAIIHEDRGTPSPLDSIVISGLTPKGRDWLRRN